MKIDCTKVITGLDDKPMLDADTGKPQTTGMLLSRLMLLDPSPLFEQAKAYDLGLRFHKEKMIELDEPDFNKLKQQIEGTKLYNVLGKGRLLDSLKIIGEK